jgi:CheY-like chemotaxis protein
MKILMIDDDQDDVDVFSSFIHTLDNTAMVESADDGHRAIEKLLSHDSLVDLILLDLNMPRFNGFYFLETIKNHKAISGIPIIIFTTSASDHDVQRSKSLGASHFITKPADYATMKEVVDAIVTNNLSGIQNYMVY